MSQVLTTDVPADAAIHTSPPARMPLLLGVLAALVLMLIFLDAPPVQRTQEARVLETAREMLHQPWRDWMIPRLNGQLRLEKPPLAYWLSAWAFEIGGVSEGIGRVPFALAGWATVLMTFGLADWLFNRRTAFLTGTALLGGMMFAHLARLAETDILATCFVTAAIACILRAVESRGSRHSSGNWHRLSGVMIGLVILAKGLPFIFVLVFLLFLSLARRDWRVIWKWTRSGAPLLVALVGLPWYGYLDATVGLETIRREAAIGMQGMEHTGSFIQYFPDLLRAVAPWSALMVLAIILAIAVWKAQPRIQGPLLWFGAVFIPLLFGGQRQAHYLLPAMPALAILSGWLVDQSLDRKLIQWPLTRFLLIATMGVMLAGSAALPIIASQMRPGLIAWDWVLAGTCFAGSMIVLALLVRRFEIGAIAFAIAIALALTFITQLWLPSLRRISPREVAQQVRAVGNGPCYFYGENISLPLLFYMHQLMPRLFTPQDLAKEAANHPDMILVAQTKSGITPPPVPDGFEQASEITSDDQTFEIYRLRR